MIISGFVCLTFSLLLLGPSPLIGFPVGFNEFWLCAIALVAMGITFAFAMIPTFEMMLNVCILRGFTNSIALYSAVGGLWSSAYALGDFLGPVLGGMLLDITGFQWGMTIMAAIPLGQVMLLVILGLATKCKIVKLEKEVEEIEKIENALLEGEKSETVNAVENAARSKRPNEATPLLDGASV
jgi:MFS family permease